MLICLILVVASAVVGGTISKLTGGKFANGAFGAAFARSLGEVRSLRHKHANGDSIVEDRVADNSSRTEITLSRGKTTLNLDISNELDVLIDALQSESSTFADDILGEFGTGNHSAKIDADFSLSKAGTYDPKSNLITMNPNAYYGSAGRVQLILGHELIHFRDGSYISSNASELNAYNWERRVLSNYIPIKGNIIEYSQYKQNIRDQIDFYKGN